MAVSALVLFKMQIGMSDVRSIWHRNSCDAQRAPFRVAADPHGPARRTAT